MPLRRTGAAHALCFACFLLVAGCTVGRPAVERAVEGEAARPEEQASQAAALTMLSRQPRENSLALLGLSGENKPNGIEQRFRRGVPPETPAYVPRRLDSLQLAIADRTPEGWMAFYESPIRGLGPNRAYRAVLFDARGSRRWDLDLNPFLSRPTDLEIQDIRYRDGKLYFNEACQTYAAEAGGACSALVRLDPAARAVDWRTPPLTSNDLFIFYGPYLIAGYGFTAEPDSLYLVDRETGAVAVRRPLDSAHDYLEVKDGRLYVITYDSLYTFALPPL